MRASRSARPDAGAYWRVIAEHKAVALFTAPTAFRAIKKEDPGRKLLAAIRSVALPHAVPCRRARRSADGRMGGAEAQQAGDRSLVADRDRLGIAGNPVGLGMLPVKHGSPTVPMPGYDIRVVDESCKEVPNDTMGSIVAKLPLPPCAPTLWQQDERFREAYLDDFPGYYKTADAGFKDEDGYVYMSWAAPTTSSMSRAIGCRPAAWRRCWRRIRTSPNAR
jgi:propionyl-CoA synthetase